MDWRWGMGSSIHFQFSSLWKQGTPHVPSSLQWATDAAHCPRQGGSATYPTQLHPFGVSAWTCNRSFSPLVSTVGLFPLSSHFLLPMMPPSWIACLILWTEGQESTEIQGNWLILDLAGVFSPGPLWSYQYLLHTFQNTPVGRNNALLLLWSTTGSQHFSGSQSSLIHPVFVFVTHMVSARTAVAPFKVSIGIL